MDKITILETFFEVIDESLDWGLDSSDDIYSHFINGASAMVKELLEKISSENSPTTVDVGYDLGQDSTTHTKIIDGESLSM